MKFWIDFEGFCCVEAENEDEAKERFFKEIYPYTASNIYNASYTLCTIEEEFYQVVLYKNDIILPNLFTTREEADDFIFRNKLHAYITII